MAEYNAIAIEDEFPDFFEKHKETPMEELFIIMDLKHKKGIEEDVEAVLEHLRSLSKEEYSFLLL